MKKYTQAEFDTLPVIDGLKHCPTGDYTAIKVFPAQCRFGGSCSFGGSCRFGELCRFGESCSFGGSCRFGELCRFGESCRFEGGNVTRTKNPYLAVDRIGSENRKTYFFNFTDGVFIRAGCFFGSENDFIENLNNDDGAAKTEIYLAALALAKLRFAYDESKKNE
jgi:hypothetical protein